METTHQVSVSENRRRKVELALAGGHDRIGGLARRLFSRSALPLLIASIIASLIVATSASVAAQQRPSGQSVAGAPGAAVGEAVLTWTVDDTGNLPIVRSRLRWKERGTGNPWRRINIRSAAMTHTLTGLDSGKQYLAQVRVWNAAGGTGWSKSSAAFSPAAPPPPNQAPAVSIDQGDAQSVETSTALALSATASDDDGTIATYAWTATDSAGGNVTSSVFTGATDAATATFAAADAGTYAVTVTVSDDDGATAAASLTVTVTEPAPQPQYSTAASLSALDVAYRESWNTYRTLALSPAFSPDTTRYTAVLERPAGERGSGLVRFTATPSDPTASGMRLYWGSDGVLASSPFNAGAVGGVIGDGLNSFRIRVTAEDGVTTRDYRVDVTERLAPAPAQGVANQSPEVSIDQKGRPSVGANTALALSATASDDGAIAAYEWSATNLSGDDVTSNVFVGARNAATATFSAADPGLYTVIVTVTDNQGASANASLRVTVTPAGTAPDRANQVAGQHPRVLIDQSQPQRVKVNTNLALSATATDNDGTISTYVWTATTDLGVDVTSSVFTSARNASTATFRSGITGHYFVVVTVTDNDDLAATTSLWVTVGAFAPTVTIKPSIPQRVEVDTELALSATANDEGSVTYRWTATNASGGNANVFIGWRGGSTITFRAADAGSYTVTMTVTDNDGNTGSASLAVTVTPSSDATLSALTLEYDHPSGSGYQTLRLSPAFASGTTGYTAELARNADQRGSRVALRFTATPSERDVTRIDLYTGPVDNPTLYNNFSTSTANPAQQRTLARVADGQNFYEIHVTAADGVSTQIYRVELAERLNQAPTVSIVEDVTDAVQTGVDLPLTAEAEDPDGGTIAVWAWTATNAAGNNVTSSVFSGARNAASATFNASTADTYTVTVTATDDEGATGSASLTVEAKAVTTPSTNVTLRRLVVEYLAQPGSDPADHVYREVGLSPEFDSGTTDYTASVRWNGNNRTIRFYGEPSDSSQIHEMRLYRGNTDLGAFTSANNLSVRLEGGLNDFQVRLEGNDRATFHAYRVALNAAASQAPTVAIEPAGAQSVPVGRNLPLSSNARDPDGGRVYVSWTAADSNGDDVTKTVLAAGSTSSDATFNAPHAGTYTVKATVTDNERDETSASLTVTVTAKVDNVAPTVAIAHGDPGVVLSALLYVEVGTEATLTAAATDDRGIAGYIWAARALGSDVWAKSASGRSVTGEVLSATDTRTVTFKADATGDYRVALQVTDADNATATAVPARVRVYRRGASSDASLSDLSVTTGGPGGSGPHAMILVPPFSPDTYEYSVVEPLQDSRINTKGETEFFKSDSKANAVAEKYGIRTTIEDGSMRLRATTTDPHATLAGYFEWIPRGETTPQTGLFLNRGEEKEVGPFVPGDNTVIVTVTSEDGSAQQDYTLTVRRADDGTTQPVATITGGQTVVAGADLALDGSGSTDPDGGALIGHAWYVRGPGGRDATADVLGAANVTNPTVTFNSNAAGSFYVRLAVFDDDGDVAYADHTITVTPSSEKVNFYISDASGYEPPKGAPLVFFDVILSQPSSVPVWVSFETYDGTAVAGEDYVATSGNFRFAPGEVWKMIWVTLLDDAHDEGEETFNVRLFNPVEAMIGDGHGVGTIRNTDPMPAAWLTRFGRTVAEQALDGISGRLEASRAAGMEGSVGGQPLGFVPGSGGGAAVNPAATPGQAPWGGDAGFNSLDADAGAAEGRTMTASELLRGSSFAMTGGKDSTGGNMAFWGRGAQTRFDGQEETINLDGTVTSGMLGADYGRDRWMVGLALTHSSGDGGYAGRGMQSAAGDLDGKIESSLTAAVPYAAWRASERFSVWGAAGFGSGDMTLDPASGAAMETDIDWTMAAAGMRSELLAGSDSGEGLGLALNADALWARTRSDGMVGLVATDSDASRLRVGLEGSWTVALEGGGRVVPRLELGARHDGGDAESGTGVDLGGGLAWSDPGSGLSVTLDGRTLLAHGEDGMKEQGFAASLTYDPNPATARGLSFGLRQDWGGAATGGVDALFEPKALSERSDAANPRGRWTAEAAYGFAAFGGRFTAGPHAGVALSSAARDYSLGWRVTLEERAASDFSLGLAATRRESAESEADHRIGLEFKSRW